MSESSLGVPSALVVDDDAMMRLLIRQTLEKVGFLCQEARDGNEALHAFRTHRPDIILLDVVMPQLDGYAACKRLRGMPEGAMVPIVMLTGLDDTESIDHAYELGATDFISKPINWGILGHRVRYVLRASRALQDVAKHQASLENAQRIAQLGGWECDLQQSDNYWSAETYRILGLDPQNVEPNLDLFLHCVREADRETVSAAFKELIKLGQFPAQTVRIVRPDGSMRYVQMQAMGNLDAAGTVIRISGTIQDVTELKEAEQRIRYLAHYDGSTGLPNRQFFMEHLAKALAAAKRHHRQLCVLTLDLDQFKRINDTLGHGVGNDVLLAAAHRVVMILRNCDIIETPEQPGSSESVARLDGDEFCVLITDLNHYHDAAKIAHRLLDELRKPFTPQGREVF
ncbi:MAG TPA: diguanylate cyclase, partial [Burkholderiales bacterium]|nr:diguanylate cyclase [Burkholderiales bacterium]